MASISKNTNKDTSGARNVVIVEDQERLCNLYSLLVEQLGHHIVAECHSGEDLMRFLQLGIRIDFILMDYRLPGMDGLQAAKKVIKVDSKTRIIIVTADDSIKSEVTQLGYQFLAKPFSSTQLSNYLESGI